MKKILVIGASGQIGSELVTKLREMHGGENVVAADLKKLKKYEIEGPFEKLDILKEKRVLDLIKKYDIDDVYHLVAVLSAKGEDNPMFAWNLNMNSLLELLEFARNGIIKRIFWPSSIAVFGTDTPKNNTPQNTIMNPDTVYGITKLAGERWCEYYFRKFNVDVRSLRFPGLIGYKSLPGGGTTDYAVDIFHRALKGETFECFLQKDTRLPMMFMPDAINSILKIMTANHENVKIRSSYNLAAMSFTPEELYYEIKKHRPDFEIDYKPDFRQKIADSWPDSIDDTSARVDWDWSHEYDLEKMSSIILENLPKHFKF
ncbi:NAD-dependent epimerase/dehydratase family protein [Hyphobacterium sp. CCMP332]|nr:NAD-dependent epimerase/dehydratase family protein [Hyphobacterium sp. CCMP332]